MPVRNLSCLVYVRTEMDDSLSLVEGRGKFKIGGSVIDWIGIENHQPIHLTRVQIGNQRLQITTLIGWQRVRRLRRDKHRLAHIAQSDVDSSSQLCNRPVLIQPRHHHALSRVSLQILGQRGKKLLLLVGPRVRRSLDARHSNSLREFRSKGRNLARPQPQPVFGLQSGCRRCALNRVQPIQLLRRLAPLRILAH